MSGKFLFLGTGASAGVPVIGCKCLICQSVFTKEKNRRFRPSGLLRVNGKSLLIDIGPDFRSQALQFGIDSIDGLLLTHTHYDHIAGIDEVRIFNVRQKKPMPCLLSKNSFAEVEKRYDYILNPAQQSAKCDFQILPSNMGQVKFLGLDVGYCSFTQGGMQVNGFRLGNFAYISDIQVFESSIFDCLQGVDVLVLSALRKEASPYHFSFNQVIDFSSKVGAKQTWITHLGHFEDHDALNACLPPKFQVAYDGLELDFDYA